MAFLSCSFLLFGSSVRDNFSQSSCVRDVRYLIDYHVEKNQYTDTMVK